MTLPVGRLIHPTRVHHIFENYEATIRHIVELQDCPPDVTSSELQLFRANFGGHAYLCRFVSCVHATIGFASNEQRLTHESGHILSFPCTEPGCQYPAFGSQKTLRRHLSEAHEKGGKRRVILKPISNPVPRASSAFTPRPTNPYMVPGSISPNSTNLLDLMLPEAQSRQQITQAAQEEMDKTKLAERQEVGPGLIHQLQADTIGEAYRKLEEESARDAQKAWRSWAEKVADQEQQQEGDLLLPRQSWPQYQQRQQPLRLASLISQDDEQWGSLPWTSPGPYPDFVYAQQQEEAESQSKALQDQDYRLPRIREKSIETRQLETTPPRVTSRLDSGVSLAARRRQQLARLEYKTMRQPMLETAAEAQARAQAQGRAQAQARAQVELAQKQAQAQAQAQKQTRDMESQRRTAQSPPNRQRAPEGKANLAGTRVQSAGTLFGLDGALQNRSD